MTATLPIRPLSLAISPREAMRRWPADLPLAALISRGRGPWSRWSILAPATGAREVIEAGELAALARTGRASAACDPELPPYIGGRIFWLAYELGRQIEPAARHREGPRPDRPHSLGLVVDCPDAYVHDAAADRWWLAGDAANLPQLGGGGPGRPPPGGDRGPGRFTCSAFTSTPGRDAYQQLVRRAVELIHAGDAFQVNLSHRLSAAFAGDRRALALQLFDAAEPWYGAYIEPPGGPTVLSLSPELHLALDPATRRLVTRPMKGTRPARAGADDLVDSPKDAAELAMIVDLSRNDLSRVCEIGSVRVDRHRAIEAHAAGAVLQGVATVSGRLREGLSLGDALVAAFPAGSVTGAPKIRAMEIIEELEPVRRGPYCGSIGFASDSGHAALSVAIRTACLWGEADAAGRVAEGALDYSVGAGIVAESDPRAEWRETIDKAAVLQSLAPIEREP